MKKLFLFLFCTILFSCKSHRNNNDLTRSNLKGQVKSVTESEYAANSKFGQAEKGDLTEKEDYKYNDDGNMDEYNYYYSNGQLEYKIIAKFNEKGDQTEGRMYNTDGKFVANCVRTYDNNQNLLSYTIVKTNADTFQRISYKYNDKGKAIELNTYQSEGKLSSKDVRKFDEKGLISEEIEYAQNGDQTYDHTFQYEDIDKKGNWLKKITLNKGEPVNIEEREIEYR